MFQTTNQFNCLTPKKIASNGKHRLPQKHRESAHLMGHEPGLNLRQQNQTRN
jgi:hypothetical protein